LFVWNFLRVVLPFNFFLLSRYHDRTPNRLKFSSDLGDSGQNIHAGQFLERAMIGVARNAIFSSGRRVKEVPFTLQQEI